MKVGDAMMTHEEAAKTEKQTRIKVTRQSAGWEVREERNEEVVRTSIYNDWHRVERAIQAFDRRYSTNR